MKFKDIVNNEVANLTNCDQEPIHIPGSIQPHGFLLALKVTDLTIDFCSGNTPDFIGLRHEQLLGKSFEVVFGSDQTSNLKEYIASTDHSSSAPLQLIFQNQTFNCTIQSTNNLHIAEFEVNEENTAAIGDVYKQARQFTSYMQKAGNLQELCQLVADETRSITGYDRVMIYRFDEEYNGEVFAESRVENVEPFMGLHYPHTDIPEQARALYVKNLLRIIVDVNYKAVPIYTIDDAADKNLDLSFSTLRSVSPIHIEYLKNMGVAATLTISLMHENKLWGLIACHHYSPKYIGNSTRIAAQLQGHFLTSQIDVRQLAEEYEVSKKVNSSLDQLLTNIFAPESIAIEDLVQQPELLALTNAASVIILVDNEIYSHGKVPGADEIRKLANWLHTYNTRVGFSTSNLASIYPDAKKWCSEASGIIFHSLGSGLNNCIIWCRPQALQEVHWAGDPRKAIIKDERGLSPRKSFELWKEVKQCESYKWQKPELTAAANFAHALQSHVHLQFLTKEELKQRKLSEKLKEANAELENLNWIGSHDLKEPLRKIQLFASRIIDKDPSDSYEMIVNSVKRMNESAKRMQLLISDIISYSRLSHIEENLDEVNLVDIVNHVTDELSYEIEEKNAVIDVANLPNVTGIQALLQQLFANLLLNALKFSAVGSTPHVNITYEGETGFATHLPSEDKFYKVVISDNGIGFNSRFKESIFKVFTRLHNQSDYPGSGVGLALCRKIMKSHKGYITADSAPGSGASFSLYFPI